MKDAEDLDDNVCSVGGAMSRWPLKTVVWTCRTERAAQTKDAVVSALLERDVEKLGGLMEKAERVDIETDELRREREALRTTDPEVLRNAIAAEYKAEYPKVDKCPNEQTGLDRSCWSCPVPGRAMRRLRGGNYNGNV